MEVSIAYIPQKDPQSYLLRLYNVHVPCGTRAYREHRHLQFEISLCKSGAGTYRTKNATYPIRPGDVFVFASQEVHCITEICGDGEGLHMLNVQFEPRYLWGARRDDASLQYLQMCAAHAPAFSNRLPAEEKITQRIAELLLETETELGRQQKEYALMVRNRITEMMVLLLRETEYAQPAQSVGHTATLPLVRRAIDYIGAHLQEQISLQDVAQAVAVTPNYLSAIFPKTVGVSLWSYLTEKRIQRAMSLLEQSPHQNVLEIALACGFNSTAAFNRAFRTCVGCTPKEYRKNGADYLT